MKEYKQELDAAIRAANKAGALIREHAGHINEADVRKKGRNDLVTEVDEAAQAVVIRTMQETFPDSRFLAEEGDAHSHDVEDGYLWIIDPIDGTINFTRGIPPFAVSIGLRDSGDVVVGAVLDVPSGEMFTAVRGRGFHLNGERREVSTTGAVADSIITTGFPFREIGRVNEYLDVLGDFMRRSRGVRRPGSAAIDLAWVACGRFDGFFETGLYPWDVAAGMLLVEEAGGRVTNFRDRDQPLFDEELLATNGRIHAEMLEMVAPLRDVER